MIDQPDYLNPPPQRPRMTRTPATQKTAPSMQAVSKLEKHSRHFARERKVSLSCPVCVSSRQLCKSGKSRSHELFSSTFGDRLCSS